jgi:hypothetical protein
MKKGINSYGVALHYFDFWIKTWMMLKVDEVHRGVLNRQSCMNDFTSHWRIYHIWKLCHCRWRAAKCMPMLGAECLWIGGYLSCHTCFDTAPHFFSGFIRRTDLFSCVLWHTRRCWGPILKRILTGNVCNVGIKTIVNKRPRGHIAHLSHIGYFAYKHMQSYYFYCGPNCSGTMTWFCSRSHCK